MFDSFGFVRNLENFISKINKTLASDEQEGGREVEGKIELGGWARKMFNFENLIVLENFKIRCILLPIAHVNEVDTKWLSINYID